MQIKDENGKKVDLPRYQCIKVVSAAKILETQVDIHKPGAILLKLLMPDNSYAYAEVNDDWLRRHNPRLKGYFVVYEGGYTSYSPAKAFEDGYLPTT